MRISLALLAGLVGWPVTAAEPSRPNVVIVLVDDLGWGDPSCYGNPLAKTPHIDGMAAEGVRFTQGYVAAPICSPSRCGSITGQSPARWKITSYLQTKAGNRACEMADFLDPLAPSLPRMLQSAGYATAHIGKSEDQMKAVKVDGDTPQLVKYKAVLVETDRQIGRLLAGLKRILLRQLRPGHPFDRH